MAQDSEDFSEFITQTLESELVGADLDAIRIAHRVRRLALVLEQSLAETLSAAGIAVVGDYDLMCVLFRQGPTRPSDAAALLKVTQAGVTGRMKRLGRAGLVDRAPDPVDARSALIILTEHGRVVTREGFARAHTLYLDMFESLPISHRTTLATLLATALETPEGL